MGRLGKIVVVCAAAIALHVAGASAAATRSEYAAQVNPICASANAQADQVFKRLARKVRKLDRAQGKKGNGLGLLGRIGKLFAQADRRTEQIYDAELAQIAPIAPAPGDEAVVASWLGNRAQLLTLVKRISRLNEKIQRLFSGIPDQKGFAHLKRLERRSKRLAKEYARLDDIDLELGTQLGVSYCVTGATATFITVGGGSTKG
jgi:hypothetical protein